MSQFIKKVSITAVAAIVAVTMVAPAPAQAAALTQAQIDAIVSLLQSFGADSATVSNVTAALSGQPTSGTGTGTGVSGVPAGYTWTRNLTVGDTGTDVQYLQVLLNSDSATQVATTGAGSPGNETTTFGPLTAAAVTKFQDKYASEVLTPLGLSAGTGFFGSSSRAKAAALAVGGTGTGTGTGTPTPTTPGVLNVSVSGPASSTIVVGQATANLANFILSGTGTVTTVKLKRIGVSADTSLSSVFLFDGATRLTDSGSVAANSEITFTNPSGLFTVSGSKTISVKANIASGASAGETVGIQLMDVTLSSGTVGGLPVSGNLHTTSSVSLATAAVASAVGSGDTNAGPDVLVWQGQLTVSTRDVKATRMALRQIGSINTADINNFRLFIDGVQVAQAQSLDANRYVTFSFDKTLTTGAKTVKVLADVIGGSGRTVQLSLRGAYDLTLEDSQITGANVAATGTLPFGPAAFTVNSGTMTVVKTTDSPSTNLVLQGTDVPLARYTFTAYGEPIKVETLLVDFTHLTSAGGAETSTLRNGRVLVNGSQVGSTTTLDPASTGTSFTTNFIVNPGSPATVEVRADVFDNDSTNGVTADDTIKVTLSAGSANAIPQESLSPIGVPTSSAVDGNTLTVSSGTLALSKNTNYGNQNVIVPQTSGYKLADFNLTNNDVETVNVNTITITFTGASDTFEAADLTDVYIKYGSNTTPIKSTVSEGSAYSVTFTMAKNEVMPVQVWGNVLSGNVTGDDVLIPNLAVTATTASGQAANVSATAGQTLTAKTSGSVTISFNGGLSEASKIVADGQTIDTAVYNFATVTDSYTITDVTVSVANATAVQNVILKNGTTVLGTKPVNASNKAVFSGLNVSAPADSVDTNLTVALQLGTVGVGAGSTGASIQVAMPTVTARSTATGTSAVVSGLAGLSSGNATYVYASIPQVTRVGLPTTSLGGTGTYTLGKFTVNSDGGTIGWKELLFSVTKTSGANEVSITNATVWDADTNTEITGTDVITTLHSEAASGTIAFTATNEQQINGSKNYLLKATVTTGSALSSGDNIATTFGASGLGFVASTAQGSVGSTATLVWTDRSAASHGTGTNDWNNDNLVKFLPLDAWSITRS